MLYAIILSFSIFLTFLGSFIPFSNSKERIDYIKDNTLLLKLYKENFNFYDDINDLENYNHFNGYLKDVSNNFQYTPKDYRFFDNYNLNTTNLNIINYFNKNFKNKKEKQNFNLFQKLVFFIDSILEKIGKFTYLLCKLFFDLSIKFRIMTNKIIKIII